MDVDLLMDNENLVYSIINKYGNYYDREDLYQVGMIGVINAYPLCSLIRNCCWRTNFFRVANAREAC